MGLLVFASSNANAALISDFTDLSGFNPSVVILDDGGATNNTSAFQANGAGQLELETTVYDNIEQYAMIYSGLSLGVGQEVQLDVNMTGSDSRNIGLYVGGTAPTQTGILGGFGDRQDYIAVYGQGTPASNNFATRGFDGDPNGGGSEYTNIQGTALNFNSTVFVAQTALNTFEVGFYDGGLTGTRTLLTTLTPGTVNTADFVGIYADVRGAGTTGFADNLTLVAVPEPGSLAVLGMGASLIGLRRRKKQA